MRLPRLVLLPFLFGAFPADEPAAPLVPDGQRIHFVTEELGQRRSRGWRIRRRTTWRRRECFAVESFRLREMSREGRVFREEIREKSLSAQNGAALFTEEVKLAGEERTVRSVTVWEGTATLALSGSDGSRNETLAVPEGVLFGIHPDWLVRQDLAPNRTFELRVLDASSLRLVTERARILGRERQEVLGLEREVWVAETIREGSTALRMTFTPAGELVRLETEDIVFRLVPKEEYERDAPPVRVASDVPLDFPLPGGDGWSAMEFAAAPAVRWRALVPDSEYASFVGAEGERVRLRAVAAPIGAIPLPMAVPASLRPFLASSARILPHRQEILARSKRALRGEKDALAAVRKLCAEVHRTIRFRSSSSLNPGPLRALEEGEGDCSEHADAFASLARAAGIPTRHCHGLLIRQGRAVYHAWAEAWLAGSWVPVDTTLDRVGVPAGYLLTARCEGDGAPKDETAWAIRKGELRLSLLSASRRFPEREGEHTLLPGKPETHAVELPGGWCLDVLYGSSFRRPEGWSGAAKSGNAEFLSPDRKGRLQIEALPRPIPTREEDLDRLEENLRKRFERFRVRESRAFALRGGTGRRPEPDALLIDFSCRQDGADLRCRQVVTTRGENSFRLALWAPAESFDATAFEAVLSSFTP